MRLEFLRRMERDLDLSLEQRERIDKILKESQEQTRKIMEPVAPALHAELQRTKEEFRRALTSEQQTRFDQLLKRSAHGKESHHQDHQGASSGALSLTNAPSSPAQ
jgi:hypothetical protein